MPQASEGRGLRSFACLIAAVLGLGGCTSISIQPSCPKELSVDESGTVAANEQNPGAIATYLWEVFPPDAGTFADPSLPTTTITALKEGEVVIRLTAGDGLYQVVSACTTRIGKPSDVAVSLQADSLTVVVGETVTLTCSSIGSSDAVVLTIVQADAPTGGLTGVSTGVSEFTPAESGEFTFSCVGEDAGGVASEPALVTVSVAAEPEGNVNDNGEPSGGGGRR